MFLAACIQQRCTTDVARNLALAEELIRRAATYGAKLIATPENTAFLGPQFHKVDIAEPLHGPVASRLRELSAELGVHLLIGGLAEQRLLADGSRDGSHCYNTSVMYGPAGEQLAVYRKMHLFDVDIPGGLTIRESDSITAGDEVVVAQTALGNIGMSICYDLRFPELYRKMVEAGASIVAVPSAFTLTTGKDHWHVLLRARAIETQCWLLAPAQWGRHDDEGKRHSYGHSLIVDPWGIVAADAGHGEGIALAEIDTERVLEVRRAIPVASHRRL